MTRQLLALLFATAGCGAALGAQSSTMTASATVVTPITVNGVAPLAFGTVFPGVNKTVQWNDPTSARLQLGGDATSQLRITFTLPASLLNGVATLPVSNYAVRVNDVNSTSGANNIAVNSGVPFTRNLVAGQLWFFVGARVQPSNTQATGSYAAPLVVTAAYTGL